MKDLKTNTAARLIALILCVVSGGVAFWSSLVSIYFWDDLWSNRDYYSSAPYYREAGVMENYVNELISLETQRERIGLNYLEKDRMATLERLLDPAKTNYRYQLHRNNETGDLLSDNLRGADLETVAAGIQTVEYVQEWGSALSDQDYVYWDDGLQRQMAMVKTMDGFVSVDSAEVVNAFNQYGWSSEDGEYLHYDSGWDSRWERNSVVLEYGALRNMTADDSFKEGKRSYALWQSSLPAVGTACLISLAVFLVSIVFLCAAAGHRKEADGIVLRSLDRVPLDLMVAVYMFLVFVLLTMGDSVTWAANQSQSIATRPVVGLGIFTLLIEVPTIIMILTLAVRVKTHCVLRNTLVWRCCAWIGTRLSNLWAWAGRTFHILTMNVRLVLLFLSYLLVNAILAAGLFRSYSGGFYLIGLILVNGVVLLTLCRWGNQWKTIRAGAARVVGGDPTAQIDTDRMFPDLAEHANQLNDLGEAINHAVDERMKSEHFKAELITNVSHDLKTPLTSIINYVDLLKKENVDNQKAQEYIEVLDRKSQRLKKLTEDLVEASKASTGNVTVAPTCMNLVEFTQQAVAEYEDRLSQQRLYLVTKMPEEPVHIRADGRHMWRILDNLLGNCVKYAMEGTRVYLDVVEWDGKVSISLKNISRDPLNLSPEELTERFVRGDTARATEGSGLGLSIARSLTEVQGGTFRIATDGDLFKVTVYFPAEHGGAGLTEA